MSSFEKYHGLGNDFIVIELKSESQISIPESIQLCDRHFGVGADGVLYVVPSQAKDTATKFKMIVINADGSRPEMCGNGLRCVALYLVHQQKAAPTELTVETDAGLRHCSVTIDAAMAATVTTSLGKGEEVGLMTASVLGEEETLYQVSMGNPHAIAFRKRIELEQLDEFGPALSSTISGGTNVEIAEVTGDNQITVDVWERGVGRTLACGTGAAATAFAAIKHGLATHEKPVLVTLPGGTLSVSIEGDDQIQLTGPAERVYSGTRTV